MWQNYVFNNFVKYSENNNYNLLRSKGIVKLIGSNAFIGYIYCSKWGK